MGRGLPIQQRCAPYRIVLEGSFRRRDPVRRNRFSGKRFPCELAENPSVNTTDPELDNLQRFAGFRQTFLKPDGSTYRAGEILRQRDLFSTFVRLAGHGPEEFYRGDTARQIVADLEANDGMLTMDDFAHHQPDWVKPISVPYRDTVAFNLPPNSQGIASLSILNILNQFEFAQIPEGSAEYYHFLIEATKEAFRDRDRYLTDPAFLEIPVEEILSLEHGQAQATRIRSSRTVSGTDLKPLDSKGDTVWLAWLTGPAMPFH